MQNHKVLTSITAAVSGGPSETRFSRPGTPPTATIQEEHAELDESVQNRWPLGLPNI
jgi:hypothetical protein